MSDGRSDAGSIEREVKLGAWPGFQLPDLDEVVPGARVELLPALRLAATYYDTPDLRLARWGATVRHRLSAPPTDEPAWTLKLPASPLPGALSRREIGAPGTEHRVPSEILGLVRGLCRGAPLVPVARLRTDRRRWELRDTAGARLLEIDDDEVSVLVTGAGGRGRRLAARFRELEVELGLGDVEVLEAVVARLRAAGAGEPDPTPKVVRALGPRAVEPPDVVVPPVGRRSTAGDVVQACFAASVTRLFRHDPGVRLGGDAEDVHQARVATRRLRSDLRTFGPLLDEAWARRLRDELGWIAGLLGAVRDADVLLERLHKQAALLPKTDISAADALLQGLERQQADATVVLLDAMGSPRYTALLDALVAAARAPQFAPVPREPEQPTDDEEPTPVLVLSATATATSFTLPIAAPAATVAVGAEVDIEAEAVVDEDPVIAAVDAPPERRQGDLPAAVALPELVRRPWRRLARAMAELGPSPEDEALHAVRIEAKRCRYALEAVAPALGKDAATLAGAVADLQTVLGDLHDAVVAEAWLRDAVAEAPTAQALAAGQLIAMQRADADASRRAWAPAWARASRRRVHGWLRRGARG